ncbi:MAG: hypothetical protein ACXAB2_14205 [Candidatus Hodarchaeales archaeon]|jgi:hypothetical protein
MNCEERYRKIIEDTGLSRQEIKIMVNTIIDAKLGKISEERALLIIAKDLCIEMY